MVDQKRWLLSLSVAVALGSLAGLIMYYCKPPTAELFEKRRREKEEKEVAVRVTLNVARAFAQALADSLDVDKPTTEKRLTTGTNNTALSPGSVFIHDGATGKTPEADKDVVVGAGDSHIGWVYMGNKPPEAKQTLTLSCSTDTTTGKTFVDLIWRDKDGKPSQTAHLTAEQEVSISGNELTATVTAK